MQPGDIIGGRYRLEKLLGQGGSGAVFKAEHLKLGRAVALKFLHDRGQEAAFEEEARLAASLEHPNLARVLDFFEEGQDLVLVAEFIAGRSLDHEAEHPNPEPTVLGWIGQVMDALEYLHGQSPPVIVRDLKPANLMLTPDGRVRVIDFGISKRLTPGQVTHQMIRGMGTQGFAPLEQYGTASTDQRSDLYALGATAYNLLTGVVPPDAVDRATQGAVLTDPRPAVSDRVWQWIQKLMAMRPDGRPGSVAEARRLMSTTGKPAAAPPLASPRIPRAPTAQPPSVPPKKKTPPSAPEPEWMDDFR